MFRDRLRPGSRAALLGCTVATLFAVAGCSPAERPLIAVYAAQGGEIRARLRACPDSAITSLELMRLGDKKSGSTEPKGTKYWTGRPPEPLEGEKDISLTSLPTDWRADVLGTAGLTPGKSYALDFTSGKGDNVEYRGVATFSTSDIEKLAPGQVWADGKSMSLKAFREQADDSC
ncbi:hypothetical protein ACWD4J_21480 [Streptomyces sp. NPDC002577]